MQSGAFLCIFANFCAFLCVSVRFFLPKRPAEKRKVAHKRAKMCKKRFYAIPPLCNTPFCVSPTLSPTQPSFPCKKLSSSKPNCPPSSLPQNRAEWRRQGETADLAPYLRPVDQLQVGNGPGTGNGRVAEIRSFLPVQPFARGYFSAMSGPKNGRRPFRVLFCHPDDPCPLN